MLRQLIVSAILVSVSQMAPDRVLAAAETIAEEAKIAPAAHAEWTHLLSKYVSTHEDGVNRFDYGALKANEEDSALLDAYLASFADLDLSAMNRDEKYVAYVNAYNALTVEHILGRYPLRSIRSGYIIGPWKRVKMNIGGEAISLNDIEHKVLRKEWSEPRTHYAVNCASFGCPNLKSTAWEVATLDADLTAAASAYINHPRGVTIRKDGRLRVSTIYKWFQEDFGGNEAGVIAHLLDYAGPELAAQIKANPDIKSYKYDWSLNTPS